MSAGGLLGEAKKEAARRQLYSGFSRGQVVAGSKEEDEEEAKIQRGRTAVVPLHPSLAGNALEEVVGEEEVRRKEKKEKKKRKRVESLSVEEEDIVIVTHSDGIPDAIPFPILAAIESPPTPIEKEKRKKKRKVIDEENEGPEHLSPEEVRVKEEEAYQEARLIAKKAAKEERRLEKVVRKALRKGE
ncbi:hypothetical protein P7C70_g9636, partial [Phenoliferia sp. Uapishka_3]